MERARGIEPPRPAWEAGVLPLNYARVCIVFSFSANTYTTTHHVQNQGEFAVCAALIKIETEGQQLCADLPFSISVSSELLYQSVIKLSRRGNLFGRNLLVNAVYHGAFFR